MNNVLPWDTLTCNEEFASIHTLKKVHDDYIAQILTRIKVKGFKTNGNM